MDSFTQDPLMFEAGCVRMPHRAFMRHIELLGTAVKPIADTELGPTVIPIHR